MLTNLIIFVLGRHLRMTAIFLPVLTTHQLMFKICLCNFYFRTGITFFCVYVECKEYFSIFSIKIFSEES